MSVVKRKILTVFFDVQDELNSDIAAKVGSLLRKKRISVSSLVCQKRYAAYSNIAKQNAAMTVQLEVYPGELQEQCFARPIKIEYCTGQPFRDTVEAAALAKCLQHQLKITGRNTLANGNTEIPWNDIKDLPWFWKSETPFVNVKAPCPTGGELQLAKAIAAGICGYFGR